MTTSAGLPYGHPAPGFISLRTKFVTFLSLIIIVTCSGLSWYFIQNKTGAMTDQLKKLGSILVTNLAYNSRYGIFIEDQALLAQFIDGVMEVEEVVYVVITGPEGRRLAVKSKGRLTESKQLTRSPDISLYPNPATAEAVFASISSEPLISVFPSHEGTSAKRQNGSKSTSVLLKEATVRETVYDFAMPVMRRSPAESSLPLLSLQSQESPQGKDLPLASPETVYGVVQLGLSGATMRQALTGVIWNVALLTILIIVGGIATTFVLAARIITPLRGLAIVARQVAEGDLNVSAEPTSHDEVGQLTHSFNQMTKSLKERGLAISSNILTITKQVRQLTALNQAGAAITSTLDLDKLLTTVLQLLVENVGFGRMLLVLYESERGIAHVSRIAGVPEEVERAARQLEIPIQDDGSTEAEMLIHGRALLVSDIAMVSDRMYPPLLALARQIGINSFVGAPLKSKHQVLGYLAADRGEQRCTQDDLELLTTVASHVAVAIDNARTYQELELLTQTLEERVQDRTQELQIANEKLRQEDERKTAFVSIVSHELRTPMTSIRGYVENMLTGLTGDLTEKQSTYLTRVKYNMERLTRMTNDLLDLSKMEAGLTKLYIEPVSMLELVNDVLESVQMIASEKSIMVEAHHASILPTIQGDRDKLHQILTNLVHNAIKFTPKGGLIRVETLVRNDGFVELCVADTGCGIPPHEITKVFEKFYRSQSTPREARGAGLGLSIVQSLVELHHGQIWANSAVGEGSRFFFTLPIDLTQPLTP